MNDDNNFNVQRRNLMIINILILIYSTTSNSINKFKILGIEFELNQSFDLNYILLIAWIYFLFRYISTLSFKIHKKEIVLKEGLLGLKDFKVLSKQKTTYAHSIYHAARLIKIFPYFLFNKIFLDYFIPIFFAFFSIYQFITNKLLSTLNDSSTFFLSLGFLYLAVFILISLIPDFFLNSSRVYQLEKAKDFYKEKGKSKLRAENLKKK